KARTGPNGLEGVDVKKPIGLYGVLKPKLDQGQVVLLLPIADEDTFLKFLDGLNMKAEKGKDGVYTLQPEGVPFPLLFRFAGGYLHGTVQFNPKVTLPAASALLKPETVLADGAGMASLTVNLDQVPAQLRKLAVSSSVLALNGAKEKELPGATEKQKELRDAIVDEAGELFKTLLEDGTALRLQVDVDQKSHDLTAQFSLAGKAGSKLASDIGGLALGQGLAAAVLSKESAMGGAIHLTLPEAIRKAMVPAVDEAIAKKLDDLEAAHREALTPLVKALTPTAHAGKLDAAVDVRGPIKGGKYTFVAALRVEKGQAIEKAFKDLIDQVPADARGKLKVDEARVGDVNIHKLSQDLDANARELFGDVPLYFALRDDALLVAFGADGLATLKQTVQAKPAVVAPVQTRLALGRMAPLMAKTEKAATDAAKQAFTTRGSDVVSLSVRGGSDLKVQFRVKTAVLTFASLLDKSRKEKE
ncbi:MAG: hypothetical protein U0736_09110, partial [Gemmataceae bacterium]